VFNNFASANSTAFVDVNQSQLSNFATAVKNTGFTAANSAEQWLSDMFVEDASFFRMDDINLGYTFKDIRNWKGNIRVAASCQNVFVLTGFSGIDPKVNDVNGVSNTFWPRPRTYSLRLNINF
jgi:iron complex outermembrane receptor protein